MKKSVTTMRRQIACCLGCNHNYEGFHSDSHYCHQACYQRHRRVPLPGREVFGYKQIPLNSDICSFRETLYRIATSQVEFYTVTSLALRETFPLPEEELRSTGLKSQWPGYRLFPFEFPLVPLADNYLIRFWARNFAECRLEKPLEVFIKFTHKLPRKCRKEIVDATARLEAARLRETVGEIREEVTLLPTGGPSPQPKIERPLRKKQIAALPGSAAKGLPPRRP